MRCLMYHRVSRPDTNPWGVCVSPDHFEEQIRWLTRQYHVITPAELVEQMQNGETEDEALVISFDDGYRDNFTGAAPVLEKYKCPATFFIPTAFIGSDRSFWWDELEHVFLRSTVVPAELQLYVAGSCHYFSFSRSPLSPAQYSEHCRWRWYGEAPTERCTAFLNIWNLVRVLPQNEIEDQMERIRLWSATPEETAALRLPMTKPELTMLAAHPLFTIGAHTHFHPDLSSLSPADQAVDINRGLGILRDEYHVDTRFFAYPYGLYNQDTLALVRNTGLQLCFTTREGNINGSSDPFEIARLQAEDLDLDSFRQRMLK